MADGTQAPGVTGAAPSTEPDKREVPSFSAVVAERAEARTNELTDLAGIKPDGAKPAAEGAPAPDAYDFEAEWTKLPERLRTEADKRYFDNYNRAISEEYGDVLPLIVEAKGSPELREALRFAAKDKGFRDLISDDGFRKEFNKLTDKEQREFLLGPASETYAKYAVPADASKPPVDEREQRLTALEQRFQREADERDTGGYIAGRQREMQALRTQYPTLQQDEKFLGHVIEIAESRFESAAMRAGIKTGDNPGWPAQALRAGVKPPSYIEAYQYQAEISGRTAPPAAPATSPATPPAKPQAPRTSTEGKARGLELVKKAGGFNSLAAATKRRG